MKKEIIPEFLWHLDEVVLAFQTTIITTVDKDGRVNAAPFGLVYPFSTGSNPQLLATAFSGKAGAPWLIQSIYNPGFGLTPTWNPGTILFPASSPLS